MLWDEERGLLAVSAKRRLVLFNHDGADFVVRFRLTLFNSPMHHRVFYCAASNVLSISP